MDVEMYERALKQTGEIVANIKPQQFDDPTPCTEWNVRDVLNHLVGEFNTFTAGSKGEKLEMSLDIESLGDDHIASYEKASAELIEAFRAPGAMEKKLTLPQGDTPAPVALSLGTADAVVHGWDLAQGTGQELRIDDDIAEEIYATTSSMMQPLGEYPRGDSFADPVEIPDDAPITNKMLAYLGRKP